MRRLLSLFALMAVLAFHASAQFMGDGFYRVQNYGTQRYLYLTDNTGSYDMKRDIGDFGALQLFTGKEKTISDPASVFYLKQYGSQVDIQGQGTGIYRIVNRYVDLGTGTGAFKNTYTVSATEMGITKYLDDEETNRDIDNGIVGTNRNSPYRNWLLFPIDTFGDNYFGITPTFSVNGKYYYPLYAAFPFKTASSGMKVYKISKYDVELGYAVLSEVTGVIPSLTPVIIECSSANPSNNRLELIASSASPLSENCLYGNLFCNYDRRTISSAALKPFTADRMRVIGITSKGKMGFVTSTQYLKQIKGEYYLPSNTSFLLVPYGSISELTAVSEAEYEEILADRSYTITYMIDGTVYKTEQLKPGQAIQAEIPTREGYTFSGWTGLPDTMPAQNITVTGSFTANSYNVTYVVDGAVYQVVSVPCGSALTPPTVSKQGYTFSGWSGLPATMPAHDITVTGTFTPTNYTLTYYVDDVVYEKQTLAYGSAITPLPNPSREGYTFSGWSYIPATMPAYNVIVKGTFTSNVYTLKYMVDGALYQQQELAYGSAITPPSAPSKEGHTFKGWEGLPNVMPAGNLIVNAVYEVNVYTLTYKSDNVVYKVFEVPYGTPLTAIDYPEKEGYVFSGWSYIPATMPAYNVIVSGTFTIGTYKIEYVLNGAGYKDYVFYSNTYKYGQTIVPYTRSPRNITGYTFMGWSEIPEKMPGHDVIVNGVYKGIDFTVTYILEGEEYRKVTVACGDSIPELIPEKEGFTFTGWEGLPVTMPAKNITVTGSFRVSNYLLKYILVMGEKGGTQLFRTSMYAYGAEVKAPATAPSRLGYTFIGWENVPATMPAAHVTVLGRYKANTYTVSYRVLGKVVHQQEVAFGDSIPAYTYETDGLVVADEDWQGTKYQSMPAQHITYNCPQDVIDRLKALPAEEEEEKMMFDLSGRRVSAMKAKGIYIINGKKILKQ